MPSIIVDAGPLIALFDRDDRYHRQAVEFVRDCRSVLVTNLPVLTEAAFLLRFSTAAQRDLLWWALRALEIDTGTAADLPRIVDLLEKYSDLPADFADVSLVALAERSKLTRVASLDREFALYRLPGRRRFETYFHAVDGTRPNPLSPGQLHLYTGPVERPACPNRPRKNPRHCPHRLSRRRQDHAAQPHPVRAARAEIRRHRQ